MKQISKSDKFKTLTIDLKKRFSSVDPHILQGIDIFLSRISNEELAFANKNRSGKVFGRYSVVQNFCDIFDPLLAQLISQCPPIGDELLLNEISLPLANSLYSPDACNILAFKFSNSAAHFDYIAERCHEQNNETLRNGESIKVIAEILQIISSIIRTDEICWCKFCFRRAIANYEYCNIHYSSNEPSQDTSNRRGNRVFKLIDHAILEMRERHRIRRRLGGEGIFLMPDKLPGKVIYPTETWLTMSEDTIAFVEATIKYPWSEVSSDWNRAIYFFPEISKRFIKPAESFANWNDFVASLFLALQETIETTRHPLWVIYIMKDAEAWFVAERKYSDRRRNDTRDKVTVLSQEGYSVADIASKLGLNEKHIAQLLHDMNDSK